MEPHPLWRVSGNKLKPGCSARIQFGAMVFGTISQCFGKQSWTASSDARRTCVQKKLEEKDAEKRGGGWKANKLEEEGARRGRGWRLAQLAPAPGTETQKSQKLRRVASSANQWVWLWSHHGVPGSRLPSEFSVLVHT